MLNNNFKENNNSLHLQHTSKVHPIRIDLINKKDHNKTLKTVRSQSKLKNAILKDSKMKFRSKAQSMNKLKGKLKIPPKLPYFKKKGRNSMSRNSKQFHNYIQVQNQMIKRDNKIDPKKFLIQKIKTNEPKKYINYNKNNNYSSRNRSNTQPNIAMNFSTLKQRNSLNSYNSKWKNSNEREKGRESQRNSNQLKNSLKLKINKSLRQIREPIEFNRKQCESLRPEEFNEYQKKLHSNFIKNVKNVHSHKSIATDEDLVEDSFIKVVRVSVNGKNIPLDQIKSDKKLHKELKNKGYNSFEDNGIKGFRKRSRSRSVNNSRNSSETPKRYIN